MKHRARHTRPGDGWFSRRLGGRHRAIEQSRRLGTAAVALAALALVTSLVTSGPQVVSADDSAAANATDNGGTGANTTTDATTSTGGTDLRRAGVFAMSNAREGNAVLAFSRGSDGRLREVGRYPTGGIGSGSFEDSANGLVLGTADGEASPANLIDQRRLLFVPNAGSSSISVFEVMADKLRLIEEIPSGGHKPVSLTVNHGLLYVLNSGETDNRLFLDDQSNFLENCTSGNLPTLTGFRVSADGHLAQIPNSTRTVTASAKSGCAQVSFNPSGTTLVVSERLTSLPVQPRNGVKDDSGSLTTFEVNGDGTLGRKQTFDATGRGPFGFVFTRSGQLLTTEQNGGFDNPKASTVAAYGLDKDGTLQPVGDSVPTTQTDTCWIVLTNDQKRAFTSSAFGGISSLSVGEDGALTTTYAVASAPDHENLKASHLTDGNTDLVLSKDSKYLYQLNSFEGDLYAFKVNADGSLVFIESYHMFDLKQFGTVGGDGAPFGLAAS